MGTNIDLEYGGDIAGDEETIAIQVSTASGDIRVTMAS